MRAQPLVVSVEMPNREFVTISYSVRIMLLSDDGGTATSP